MKNDQRGEADAAQDEDDRVDQDASVKEFLKSFQKEITDPDVTEIAVNDEGRFWFERNSVWHERPDKAITSSHIEKLGVAVATFSKQTWDRRTPLLSAAMYDGSRIQLVRSPAVEQRRNSFTLRKPT